MGVVLYLVIVAASVRLQFCQVSSDTQLDDVTMAAVPLSQTP